MIDLSRLQFQIHDWSDSVFGSHRIALPMVHHLKKEVDELIEALEDLYKGCYSNTDEGADVFAKKIHAVKMEYADCLMLLIDSAAHIPLTMEAVIRATEEKLEINKKRKWGTQDENGVVEHIRD